MNKFRLTLSLRQITYTSNEKNAAGRSRPGKGVGLLMMIDAFCGDAKTVSRGISAVTGKTYSIAQLAQELGATMRAIRFYESKGLIAPRRAGKNRIYSHRDRARLILILRGKRMGFSLREIREFLDLYVVDATQVTQMRSLLGKVRDRIALLETQLQDVETSLAELRDMERVTQDILAAKGVQIHASNDGL